MAVWLYLCAGASRSASNSILRAIQYLITTFIALLEIALASHGITVKFPPITIPRDVRSAYTRCFDEPEFKRTMCCPQCFYMYGDKDPDEIPERCNWSASPFARPCGAELWTRRRTRGGVTMVPKCLYTTQNFTTWLKFFLSRKVIDDALQETQRKHSPTWNSLPSVMRDVQGSPGWYNLFGGERGAYDLSFGIYVDWFRAFKLKIAGKCL